MGSTLIKDLKREMESRLYTVRDEMMGRINARFDGLDARFDRMDARFDRMEEQLERIARKFDA